MPAANSELIAGILKALKIGATINSVPHATITGYNPRITLEWTAGTPYRLIVHEYFAGKHFRQICELDDYKGEVTDILAQEDVT